MSFCPFSYSAWLRRLIKALEALKAWRSREIVKGNKKLQLMFKYLILRSWKIISKIVNIIKLTNRKQEDRVYIRFSQKRLELLCWDICQCKINFHQVVAVCFINCTHSSKLGGCSERLSKGTFQRNYY